MENQTPLLWIWFVVINDGTFVTEVMMMVVPEAWETQTMSDDKKAFDAIPVCIMNLGWPRLYSTG
jgi:glutamate synthase domain-containing protein 1